MSNTPSLAFAPLSPVEVRVWSVLVDRLDGAEIERCAELLGVEERVRAERQRPASSAGLRIVAYALSRLALSDAAPVAPADWRLERDDFGRPFVIAPADGPKLRFSLTHTPGLVACAVALDRDLGVDAETLARTDLDADLATSVFTPEEISWLDLFDAARVDEERLGLWTRKEAYLKARGLGMALDLKGFSVAGDPPALRVHGPATEGSERRWLVADHRPSPRHRMALVVAHDEGERLDVRFLDGLPLHR